MKTIIHVTPIKKARSQVFRALTTQAGLSSCAGHLHAGVVTAILVA